MVITTEPSLATKSALKLHNEGVKKRSKTNFAADTKDNELSKPLCKSVEKLRILDEEDEEDRAKKLLRSRRQSRGGGAEIRLEVKSAAAQEKQKQDQVGCPLLFNNKVCNHKL